MHGSLGARHHPYYTSVLRFVWGSSVETGGGQCAFLERANQASLPLHFTAAVARSSRLNLSSQINDSVGLSEGMARESR